MMKRKTTTNKKEKEYISNDAYLVEQAVRTAGSCSPKRTFRWAHVSNIFAVGSTSAYALCRRFNINPDEIVGGHFD